MGFIIFCLTTHSYKTHQDQKRVLK